MSDRLVVLSSLCVGSYFSFPGCDTRYQVKRSDSSRVLCEVCWEYRYLEFVGDCLVVPRYSSHVALD